MQHCIAAAHSQTVEATNILISKAWSSNVSLSKMLTLNLLQVLGLFYFTRWLILWFGCWNFMSFKRFLRALAKPLISVLWMGNCARNVRIFCCWGEKVDVFRDQVAPPRDDFAPQYGSFFGNFLNGVGLGHSRRACVCVCVKSKKLCCWFLVLLMVLWNIRQICNLFFRKGAGGVKALDSRAVWKIIHFCCAKSSAKQRPTTTSFQPCFCIGFKFLNLKTVKSKLSSSKKDILQATASKDNVFGLEKIWTATCPHENFCYDFFKVRTSVCLLTNYAAEPAVRFFSWAEVQNRKGTESGLPIMQVADTRRHQGPSLVCKCRPGKAPFMPLNTNLCNGSSYMKYMRSRTCGAVIRGKHLNILVGDLFGYEAG